MNIRRKFFAAACVSLLAASGLSAQVPQIINYQGRVVVGSTNFNGTGQFKFALINNANDQTLWSNDNTSSGEPANAVSVSVANGLYSVLLGDTSIANMTAIPPTVFGNSDVRLRVWFNDGSHGWQQFTPDQRIASVGYAMIAGTVPDLAISTGKLANNSVTSAKIDNTTVQQRVTGSAIPGRFIRAINADGTVVTGPDDDSGGTVTSVTAAGPLSVTNGTTTPNISLSGTVPVTNGGTGASTFPPNSIPIANGTAAFATTGPLTDGQLVIGRTGLTPSVGNLTGTVNEITVTSGSGSITLGLANNAGTDISGDLEEESQIRSTNVSNNAASGQLLLGNGASTAAWASTSGDVVISSSGNTTIQTNAVALGNDSTGSYVRAVSTFNGLAGGNGSTGSEDAVLSLGLDYSATLTSNILAANQTQFASTGILFEGTNADNNEGLLTPTNPTADRTWTLPDATGTVITTGNLDAITSTGTLSDLTVTGPIALGNGTSPIAVNGSIWDISSAGNITTPGFITTTGTSSISAGGRVTIGTFANLTKSGPVSPNANDDVTATTSYVQLSTPSADNLDTLNGGTAAGQIVILAGPATNTIAVLDLSNGFATAGNINLAGSATFTMDASDTLTLLFDGTAWIELARSVN